MSSHATKAQSLHTLVMEPNCINCTITSNIMRILYIIFNRARRVLLRQPDGVKSTQLSRKGAYRWPQNQPFPVWLIPNYSKCIVGQQNQVGIRRGGYLHFDSSFGLRKVQAIAAAPHVVAQHVFYPSISYTVESETVRVDAHNKLATKVKERPVAYASHLDARIYSYYAQQLQQQYKAVFTVAKFG